MGGSSPYVGMLLAVGFNFAPAGWRLCDGSALSISENSTLFNLIGTTFGGDGQQTFNLPDLRGRIPIHFGNGYVIGQNGGAENVTLTSQQAPVHSHTVAVSSNNQNSAAPNNNFLASGPQAYIQGTAPNVNLAPQSITPFGGSQPHNNLQPFLTLNWIISLFGVFPSQG